MTNEREFLAKEAQAVFFIAMRVGYAGGLGRSQKTTISSIPGSKSIVWESMDGYWKVADTYVVTPDSHASTGMTVIAFEGKPVWTMHYGGYYHEAVIPFLKRCLAEAYENDVFFGGRGGAYRKDGDYTYFNNLRDGSTFVEFSGEEFIVNADTSEVLGKPAILGKHWYRGGMLFDPW